MMSQVMDYQDTLDFLKSVVPLHNRLTSLYKELDDEGAVIFNAGGVLVSISEAAIMSDKWLVALY